MAKWDAFGSFFQANALGGNKQNQSDFLDGFLGRGRRKRPREEERELLAAGGETLLTRRDVAGDSGSAGDETLLTPRERQDVKLTYQPAEKREFDEQVQKFQGYLLDEGYDLGKDGADGFFGEKTLSAVKKFQKDNGIKETGIIDEETYGTILAKRYNRGGR